MKWSDLTFASHRSPVLAVHGMVCTSQPLASAAGLEMLRRGGTAADAAVAAAAALSVTEPGSTGLGGDAFAIYFEAKTGTISALNGSGRAPAALSLDRLAQEGLRELPRSHGHAVTVPGACSAWCALAGRFGRLPLTTLLTPAESLAEEGFPVSPITAQAWDLSARIGSLVHGLHGRELTLEGRGPRPGERFYNPGLARTLRAVAEGGADAFYRGALGEAVVQAVQQAGGCMTMEDLAAHTADWVQPISTTYRGQTIWECPPNGQGLTALLALNILEELPLEDAPPLSAQRLHWQIEAMKLAFGDALLQVADPQFASIPLEELLSKSYAAQRRRQIDPDRAAPVGRTDLQAGSDTVYLCAVDGEGNACSFINSTYMHFGTGIVPAGLGFSLQNRGCNFSLDPQHPNVLAPGKRPYHTIIPALITRPDGSLYGPLGVMGGFMQPQGHVQVISGLLDDDLDPQSALDRVRFCLDPHRPGVSLDVEVGMHESTLDGLRRRGHTLREVSGAERAVFGRGQIILRGAEGGVLCAGSDPRGDGCAIPLI